MNPEEVALLPHIVTAAFAVTLLATPLASPASQQAPASAPAPAPARAPISWRIDTNHSELSFEVRHLVSRVRGTFRQWNGNVTADPANWESGQVAVTIQANSIDTNNEKRDSDLRSSSFFAVDSFPTIAFRSERVETNGKEIKIHGTLTMRGVSKPVVLSGEALGIVPERGGKRRAGFEASTTINRLDYGITWNRVAEGGGAVLADDVKIEVVVALVEQ